MTTSVVAVLVASGSQVDLGQVGHGSAGQAVPQGEAEGILWRQLELPRAADPLVAPTGVGAGGGRSEDEEGAAGLLTGIAGGGGQGCRVETRPLVGIAPGIVGGSIRCHGPGGVELPLIPKEQREALGNSFRTDPVEVELHPLQLRWSQTRLPILGLDSTGGTRRSQEEGAHPGQQDRLRRAGGWPRQPCRRPLGTGPREINALGACSYQTSPNLPSSPASNRNSRHRP